MALLWYRYYAKIRHLYSQGYRNVMNMNLQSRHLLHFYKPSGIAHVAEITGSLLLEQLAQGLPQTTLFRISAQGHGRIDISSHLRDRLRSGCGRAAAQSNSQQLRVWVVHTTRLVCTICWSNIVVGERVTAVS